MFVHSTYIKHSIYIKPMNRMAPGNKQYNTFYTPSNFNSFQLRI